MYSLESPHRGDSNIHFQDEIRYLSLSQIYLYLLLWKRNLGTQQRIQSNRGSQAISVRAIEV